MDLIDPLFIDLTTKYHVLPPYPNSQVKMAEQMECESSQDEEMQGTFTRRTVRINDVTSSEKCQDPRHQTKVSVCKSDVTRQTLSRTKI